MNAKSQPALPDREKEQAIATLQKRLLGLQENRAGAIKVMDRDPGMQELVDRLDREIAEVQAQLRKLRGTTPGEVLTELETKIAGAEAELRQHHERKSAAVVAKMQRDPAGAAQVEQIETKIGETEERLRGLRQQHAELRQRMSAERAADTRRATAARPLRIAELHRERAHLAETITTAAHTLAAAIRAAQANGAALSELVPEARNFLSPAAFRWRSNNAFARAFAINPNAPLTENNSLFGLASGARGAQAQWTLAEWEQPELDDLAPFFATEAEAEAARQRLELSNCQTIIVPLHGAFTLVRFEYAFGDEHSARRAAAVSAVPVTVVQHDGGYVLIAQRFIGGGRVMSVEKDPKQRVDEINALLREPQGSMPFAQRKALVDELSEILSTPAAPAEMPAADAAALAARAQRLSRALYGHEWSSSDRRILADQLGDVLGRLPDGTFTPPAMAPSREGRPVAILPVGITRKFNDPQLAGAEREAAVSELDAAIAGLGADPTAGAVEK